MNCDWEHAAALMLDMHGNVVDANTSASRLLGYRRDELRRLTIGQVVAGGSASTLEDLARNLVQGRVLIESCQCVRKDGSGFEAEIFVNQRACRREGWFFFIRAVNS